MRINMETTKAYWIRFYGNKATVVWDSVEKVGHRFHVERSLAVNRKLTYSGVLSKAAQTTIHRRLFAWLESIRVGNHAYHKFHAKDQRRLIFVTLTLSGSQRHDDRWIKKNMLELFIKRMQNKFGVVNYFWKAETQANGNLHFHLIFDVYIPMTFIQSNWNDIQRAVGYLDHYFSIYGHYNAPSTHVRELTGMADGIGYAMKYCKKQENRRPVKGSIFRFSSSLIDITIPPVIILPEYEQEWGEWCSKYVKKVIKDDFWTSLFFNTRAKGFKQPAFIAKETQHYYLCCYNILYTITNLDLSIKDLNDNTFNKITKETTPAQTFGDTSKSNPHAPVIRNSLSSGQQAPRPAGLQFDMFSGIPKVPINWPF